MKGTCYKNISEIKLAVIVALNKTIKQELKKSIEIFITRSESVLILNKDSSYFKF